MKFRKKNFGQSSKHDCVPRAMAIAFNRPYEEMLKLGTAFNRVLGTKQVCPKENGVELLAVDALMQDYFGVERKYVCSLDEIPRKGTFFIRMELCGGNEYHNHTSCIKNGVIYDSWDWRKFADWGVGDDYMQNFEDMLKSITVWKVK